MNNHSLQSGVPKRVIISIILFLFAGFGYYVFSRMSDNAYDEREPSYDQVEQTIVQEDVCRLNVVYDGDVVDMYKVDDAIAVFAFPVDEITTILSNSSTAPRTVSSWVSDKEYMMVINAAYFLENNEPAGFFVREGIAEGQTMFDGDKSGVVVLDGGPHIVDVTSREELLEMTNALQSYPYLIKDGEAAFATETGKYARRTAIGIGNKGVGYVIVSADRSISLHQLSTGLEELDRLCDQVSFDRVINLDGGPSTGVFFRDQGKTYIKDSFVPVPSVIQMQW